MTSPNHHLAAVPDGSPGHAGRPRQAGIDLARGLAVALMVVAHTSPSDIDLPAEYLTAPLFGLLIGISLNLAWAATDHARPGAAPDFVLVNLARGAILVGLGIALTHVYPPIDIVLQVLGLLTMTLAPLVVLIRGRWRVALVAAAALWLVSPIAMDAARDAVARSPRNPPAWLADLLQWTVTGAHYRLLSHLVFGLVGVALAAWLPHRKGALRAIGALAAVTVTAYGLGHVLVRARPYTGDHFELLGSVAFAAGATMACVWLADRLGGRGRLDWRAGVLTSMTSVGRLALSAYTLQILLLAALAQRAGPLWDDDRWWVLATTLAVCVGTCLLWDRLVHRPGPLEWVLRLPRYAVGRRYAPGSR